MQARILRITRWSVNYEGVRAKWRKGNRRHTTLGKETWPGQRESAFACQTPAEALEPRTRNAWHFILKSFLPCQPDIPSLRPPSPLFFNDIYPQDPGPSISLSIYRRIYIRAYENFSTNSVYVSVEKCHKSRNLWYFGFAKKFANWIVNCTCNEYL